MKTQTSSKNRNHNPSEKKEETTMDPDKKNHENDHTTDIESVERTRFIAELQSVEAEMAAIPASELAVINVDIAAVTMTAIGCIPELRAHRDAMTAALGPKFGGLVERLEVYARAASQANVDYHGAAQQTPDLQELSQRAIETRTTLLAIAQLLVQRKIIAASELEGLRGPMGFRNQVFDLQKLVRLLSREAHAAARVVTLSKEEIEGASKVADELFVAIGEREQAPPVVTKAADTRQRAYTLFARTYEQLRRAVTFLRWEEDDVDSIIPSLYAGRGGRGKRDVPQSPVDTGGTDVIATPPTRTTPAREEKPEDKPEGDKPAVDREVKPGPGMPGADPFVS